MTAGQELGRRGEDAAASHYESLGFIVERNWRCSRGELDLVCTRGELVVFCEVKTRSSPRFGHGVEAVDWRKQRKLRQLAGVWLSEQRVGFDELRFDVADVDARGHLQLFENCM